jgi:hypothetical protein
MDVEKYREAMLRRMDVLIALQLERPSETDTSVASKVGALHELGLSPTEIAGIVRKPANYVTATLSNRARRKKGKGKTSG